MIDKRHILEVQLVDFVLGNASAELQEKIVKHTNICTQCEKRLKEWNLVLSEPTNVKPSLVLKEIVVEKVERKLQPKVKRSKQRYIVAICSAVIFFLTLLGLLIDNHLSGNTYEIARNDEINRRSFQKNSLTQQVAVIPVSDFNDITGNLWINDVSQELLLEVDGLAHISNRDYQLWIVYDNDEIRGELLSTKEGASQVMIKGSDVRQFKFIKASLEPLGGSAEPTGPETFTIPIKN